MSTTVAQVALDVLPDLSRFGKELSNGVSKAMPAAEREADKGGNETGRRFGKSASDSAEHGLKGLAGKAKGQFGDMAKVAVGAFAVSQVGDFIGESIKGWQDHQRILRQTAQVISSTGGAAKLTADQMGNLSDSIESNTGVDGDNVLEAENLLATFTNIKDGVGKGKDIFSQTTKIMTDMSVAMGTSVKGQAVALGKALNDPIKGVSALSRVGVTFTDSQKKVIAHMVKTGDTAGAQAVILKELNKEFGGSAAAQETSGQKMEVAIHGLQDAIGQGLTPIIEHVATFLSGTVIPIFTRFVGWLEKNGDTVKMVALALAPLVAAWAAYSAITKVVAVAQGILNAVMEANPITIVVTALAALAVGLYLAYQKSETFRHIVQAAFTAVKSVVLGVINWFRTDFLHFFTDTIPHAFTSMVNWIKSAFHNVVGFMKTWGPVALAVLVPFIGIPLLIWQHFGAIKGWIASVFSSVVGTIRHWIDEAVNFISGLPGRLGALAAHMLEAGGHLMQSFLNGLANAAGAVGDVAKNIVNDVIGFINGQVIDPIRDFSFTIGAFGFHHTFQPFGSLPEIPRLATGGMTTGLTAAVLGDNQSGQELVLPLDSPRTIAALAQAMGKAGHARPAATASRITGELRIAPDSQGNLRAWVRDVVMDEQEHTATVHRMRAGAYA